MRPLSFLRWSRVLALLLLVASTTYFVQHYRQIEVAEEHEHLRQYAALLGEQGQVLREKDSFQSFCWSFRINDHLQGGLVDADGALLATCQSPDAAGRESLLGHEPPLWLNKALQHRGADTKGRQEGWLIAYAEVQGLPSHFVILALPEYATLDHWQEYVRVVIGLSLVLAAFIIFGPGLVGRRLQQLETENISLEQQRQMLQNRIQTVTRDLRQQKEDAEKANASKSRFLAAATHDLRQPLSALNLFADDLERQVKSADRQVLVRLSSRIKASARGLRTLIDALLDFSCIDVDKIRPNLQVCELNNLFSILERTFSCAAEEKRLGLSFRDTSELVYTDPILLERLLGNLIANAITYTYQGRILVAARRHGENVNVEVFDTGIGIPESQLNHIFEEFYQVENTAREHNKGLGLGLAIVHKLALAMNASVKVQSTPGQGSRFTVSLPRVPAGQRVQFPTPHALPAASPAPVQPLYFIGESEIFAALQPLVTDWGYEVIHGENFEALPSDSGTLAITDLSQGPLPSLPETLPGSLIVLGAAKENMPPWVHHLSLPLRPARLRTLLNRLGQTPEN